MVSMMSIPLQSARKVIGALSLVQTRGEGRFGEDHLKLLSILGNHASIAIENTRLKKFDRQEADRDKRPDKALSLPETPSIERPAAFPLHNIILSGQGALIRTNNPMDPEDQFPLRLELNDGEGPLEVLCKVVWTNRYGRESEDMPRGMSVKFIELQPEQRLRIERFIRMQKSGGLFGKQELVAAA